MKALLAAGYDAALFDLDGVLTATQSLHADTWRLTFDGVLAEWARRTGTRQAPFDVERDYVTHVDGKPRLDGVRDFLRARGADAPPGGPASPPGEWSVHGIARRKQQFVQRALAGARARCAGSSSCERRVCRWPVSPPAARAASGS